MIEVLFARLNQLTDKLRKIAKYTTGSTYGDGALGNWYVGFTNNTLPEEHGFDQLKLSDNGVNVMPIMPTYSFENLTIEQGAVLTFQGELAVLRVKDTLTLKGSINMANKMSGAGWHSCGATMNGSTLRMTGEMEILPDAGKYITGSNGQGGFIVTYYHTLKSQYDVDLGTDWGTAIKRNAGNGAGGGFLCVIAKNIILYPTGMLDVRAGDGSGAVSGGFYNFRLRESGL